MNFLAEDTSRKWARTGKNNTLNFRLFGVESFKINLSSNLFTDLIESLQTGSQTNSYFQYIKTKEFSTSKKYFYQWVFNSKLKPSSIFICCCNVIIINFYIAYIIAQARTQMWNALAKLFKWIHINYLSLSLDLKFPRPENGNEQRETVSERNWM